MCLLNYYVRTSHRNQARGRILQYHVAYPELNPILVEATGIDATLYARFINRLFLRLVNVLLSGSYTISYPFYFVATEDHNAKNI